MIKKILFGIVFLFFAIQIKAQTAGGSLMLGFPQGEFKNNVDRLGYGLQLQGTIWTPSEELPFSVGAEFGYLIYGEETSRRPLSVYIPDVNVDVETKNSIANFHLLFQIMPFNDGSIRPYLEGLFGGAYIFTKTSVESMYDDDDVFESTNLDDFTWSYGAGGGLLILLDDDMENMNSLFLDIKFRYTFGSEAEYLKEGSIQINSGNVSYDVIKSKTDLFSIHVGVTVFF